MTLGSASEWGWDCLAGKLWSCSGHSAHLSGRDEPHCAAVLETTMLRQPRDASQIAVAEHLEALS